MCAGRTPAPRRTDNLLTQPRTAPMNLKTFRAKTMADALAEVKKDLGKDAVILHTRTYRVGGWMGVGGRSVVEITASNDAPADPRLRRAQARAAIDPKPVLAPVPAAPEPLAAPR